MNRRSIIKLACLVSIFFLTTLALSQTPAGSPSTAPGSTTAPYVPHIAVCPPGLHVLKVAAYTFYCLPADDAWIKDAVASAKPVSRPSTMPSDIISSIQKHRTELIQQMTADMALPNDKGIAKAIDDKLLPFLDKFKALHPAVIFMPITQSRLTEAMHAGWSDPRYHYNRLAEEAVYDSDISLSEDCTLDDLVMWVSLDADDAPDVRNSKVTDAIDHFNEFYDPSISQLSQDMLCNTLAEIILHEVIDPLKLPPPLAWFGHGVASIYSAKYAAFISGASRSLITLEATMDEPGNPLHSQPLDLVHPKSPDELRPEVRALYNHGLYKKGASVVNAWVASGGDGVLAKVLPVLRTKPPADSTALAKIIKDATGYDISLLLPPNYKVIVLPR